MEFGRVLPKHLDSIDFSLSPDPIDNERIIKANSVVKPNVYIGCVTWGQPNWVGDIYPKGTKAADFLLHYAKSFSTIELNTTYYRVPTKELVATWKNKVDKNFRFCPKFNEAISHDRQLKDCVDDTNHFLKMIEGFGENLGPSFLLLPPNFAFSSLPILESYIKQLPKGFALNVEFRHPSWYTATALAQTFELFEKYSTGSIITDTAGKREVVHMRLTNDTAFIRFVGNGLHPTDFSRSDEWVQRIKTWYKKGLKNIYFFVHEPEEVWAPKICAYVTEKLNSELGLRLPMPAYTQQQNLF